MNIFFMTLCENWYLFVSILIKNSDNLVTIICGQKISPEKSGLTSCFILWRLPESNWGHTDFQSPNMKLSSIETRVILKREACRYVRSPWTLFCIF